MKKHLFGFALFSLIVGTAAFVYAIFNVVRVDEVPAPSYYQTYSPATSCWKMKRNVRESNFDAPKVSQAVFNVKTKQLNWKLDTPGTASSIALHFFVKDENGTRYIASEKTLSSGLRSGQIEMDKRAIDSGGRDGEVKFTSSYKSLDNLNSYENLYVIAESVSTSKIHNNNFQLEFDAAKAIPVLIDSGR